jgi:hypothetical protein
MGAGIYAGTAAAAGGLAGSTAGAAIPLGGLAFGAWSALRTKTYKGFSYELLPDVTSTNVFTANTALEFNIPFAMFNDGRYQRAIPILIALEVSKDTQTRILGTAKAEVKESITKGPGQPKLEEPYQRSQITADIATSDTAFSIKTGGLAVGEYAVAFVYDGNLLPIVVDFTVR